MDSFSDVDASIGLRSEQPLTHVEYITYTLHSWNNVQNIESCDCVLSKVDEMGYYNLQGSISTHFNDFEDSSNTRIFLRNNVETLKINLI